MTTENHRLQNELKLRQICRFCLSVDKLASIYSRDARIISTAPLPVQVMACASIEVFTNDGMPSWICTDCRVLFEHCYRFKQMCKRAETLLRQYPLTGVWPDALSKPKFPQARTPKTTITSSQAISKAPEPQPNHPKLSASGPKKILNSNPVASPEPPVPKRMKKEKMDDEAMIFLNKVDNDEELSMDDVQRLIAAADNDDEFITEELVASPQPTMKPRVLNKSSIRILNKEAEIVLEPRMSKPQVKRDQDGNVAIVTEILDPNEPYEPEIDHLKNAELVETHVFPCPHCERSFPLRQLRDIHLVNHNRERSFHCPGCDKSFFSKYDLQKHSIVHTGDRPYKCTVCQKDFTRATLLHRHEKIHTDIPKYVCVFCEKSFICKEELDKHTERHQKNRPYPCKVCNKSFAFKQGLERHEVVHSLDQPYPCQYCEQSFSTPSKLSRHLTAHAGSRPYPCKLCPKSYLLSHHLSRHMRSHKQSSTAIKCSYCDKVFNTRDGLIYHSAVHATATLVCPLCKDVLADANHVTAHIKEHAEGEAYACEFCDLIFMSSKRLQGHTDTEHADDMKAYHEDDKAKVESEVVAAGENAAEFQQTLEEFFIDDLEEAKEIKDEKIVQVERVESNQPRILNQIVFQAPKKVKSNSLIRPMFDIDSEVMVVNEADSAEEEQPSPKMMKFSKIRKILPPKPKAAKEIIEEPRRKVAIKSTVVNATPPKVQITIQKNEILVPSPEQVAKSKQPTINSMLKSLPKGVSIRRNTPVAAVTAVQSTPITTPTTGKKPSATITTASQKQSAEKKKSQPTPPPQATVQKPEKQQERVLRGRRSNEAVTPSGGGGDANKQPVTVKSSPVSKPQDSVSALGEQVALGTKKMRLQKITISKSEADAMAKDGRIRMKDGNMILTKSKPKSNK